MRGNGKGCIAMLVTDLKQVQEKKNRLLQKILLDAKDFFQRGSQRNFFLV